MSVAYSRKADRDTGSVGTTIGTDLNGETAGSDRDSGQIASADLAFTTATPRNLITAKDAKDAKGPPAMGGGPFASFASLAVIAVRPIPVPQCPVSVSSRNEPGLDENDGGSPS